MKSTVIAKGIYKAFLLIAGTFLLLYVLYLIQSVIAYVLLAAVFALIGRPVTLWLRTKLKCPNILAVSITILLLFTLLVGLVWLFVPLVTEQGEKLALLNLKNMQAELELFFQELTNSLGASKEIVEEIVEEVDLEETVEREMETGFLPRVFNSVMQVVGTMSISLFSIIFITFFLLKDTQIIQGTLVRMFPSMHRPGIMNSIDVTKNLLSRYFIGLLLQILILFIIYAATLTLVGIEHPLAIAFLCALFNIIPYVGPIIGAVFMMVFTVTSNLGLDFGIEIVPKMAYVAIGVIVGQLIDNFFSQPFIFSNSVKSHPLEIFLIIIMAGLLFGVVGMIVAVPGYTVLKVILREFIPENRIVKALTTRLK
ncbi:AI-2E family transporter [Costertonia aggregata]|uniref:AI-2E family transporter n=1 Tax=Costertonia aggregata TaxID=343403 RepID=A0A7H9ASQ3_9FLAO|nr:AI-2E family transporter [Costertonia aggregata]QLG46493.1 AI-2E family transporter [Costertonia aggregata]